MKLLKTKFKDKYIFKKFKNDFVIIFKFKDKDFWDFILYYSII